MSLQDEVRAAAADVNADGYPMSIGEIMNLYRDGELVIRPAFQRLFRWDILQKSRFIESILLGIPIPSVFVSQGETGVWEVVDGLQRLSTIFEFTGELRDAGGNLMPPSVLVGTRYLPSLEGMSFEDGDHPLDLAQRIAFKRQKLDVKIVRESNDSTTKYDLFDRLNSGGSPLSDQEFRNSLIVMSDPSFLDWLETLQALPDFQQAVIPSDREAKQQYDLELVVRFLTIFNRDETSLAQFKELRELLTDTSLQMALDPLFDRAGQGETFRRLFAVVNRESDGALFKRYDPARDRFLGKFSVSAFEVVTVGIASNLAKWEQASTNDLRATVGQIWNEPTFIQYGGGGVAPTSRIPRTVALGRAMFAD